jgi:hypothetical protein
MNGIIGKFHRRPVPVDHRERAFEGPSAIEAVGTTAQRKATTARRGKQRNPADEEAFRRCPGTDAASDAPEGGLQRRSKVSLKCGWPLPRPTTVPDSGDTGRINRSCLDVRVAQ